jgi:DNA-binding transcriptional LysR family regulator
MSLSSSQLDAFGELARAKSFSRAARNLGLTQSALSQRIAHLERDLGTSLLVREPRGLRLTEAGDKLLRYCRLKGSLEAECLADLRSGGLRQLSGVLRIAGFSTILRSIVLPTVGPLLAKHPGVRVELATKETGELHALLRTGEADFVFLDRPPESAGVEAELLGYEENVLVEPKTKAPPDAPFLDHDPDDQTTHRFWGLQRRKPENIRRFYLDEIYGILDGVALGLGRAVVPLHLARDDDRVRLVPHLKPLLVPVYLHYYRQPFYTELQKLTLQTLVKGVSSRLRAKA